jgi:hypothetical protein
MYGFDVSCVEARYHDADTGRVPTRMVPITGGIRW